MGPENGQVDISIIGSIATYTCDTGYTLYGSPASICGDNGFWTPSFTEVICLTRMFLKCMHVHLNCLAVLACIYDKFAGLHFIIIIDRLLESMFSRDYNI